MQPELLHPSWPSFNNTNSSLDEHEGCIFDMDAHVGHYQFSPHFTITDPSDISLIPNFQTMFYDEVIDFPAHVDDLDVILPKDEFSLDLEEFEAISGHENEEMAASLEESEKTSSQQNVPIDGEDHWSLSQSLSSNDTLMDASLSHTSLILPTDDMEIDNSLGIIHLVKAYGEAMGKEQTELAQVIMKCIGEKVSPLGETMERLLYYLFQPLNKQSDYLKQESAKNFHAAFKAFYQIFPYGKFAHFAANLAILEAMPLDVEIIHIIDFDMGEGIQWPSVIEAIGCQQREIRLTSIKWTHQGDSHYENSRWRFEETKGRLCDLARSFGIKLKLEEMELHNWLSEMKKAKRRGGRPEWLAFNCMVGLPHMGRVRSRRHVLEFLKVAKELLLLTPYSNTSTKGIVTFGNGDAWEILKKSSSFGSFFEEYLIHYQALLESMECNFPIHFEEARTAMECLFVAPFVSSVTWIQKWKEKKELCDLQSSFGLEGWRVSKESLMETKEMVREGLSPYAVMVEGVKNNEMVLEWRGIPLVRVSFWEN